MHYFGPGMIISTKGGNFRYSLTNMTQKGLKKIFQKRPNLSGEWFRNFFGDGTKVKTIPRLKTCPCSFAQYFHTLFWDDIVIICWWKLSKQTSYWSKTFFSEQKSKQYFHPKLSWCHPKITYENIIQKDMNKFFATFRGPL